MKITQTLELASRQEWRGWLGQHHDSKKEIWLIRNTKEFSYLDSVEEALCFGWIDGIAKKTTANKANDARLAQRFTPRKKKSHWTELNKERARKLIARKQMTKAGYAVLPNLSLKAFSIPKDILDMLQNDAEAWKNFQAFPDVYKRIRVGYIEEMRKDKGVFETRLNNFLKKTKQNKMFGTLE
jgi:uncharacterized protein YdeI (YjbR/CyaY-like superfamily)